MYKSEGADKALEEEVVDVPKLLQATLLYSCRFLQVAGLGQLLPRKPQTPTCTPPRHSTGNHLAQIITMITTKVEMITTKEEMITAKVELES